MTEIFIKGSPYKEILSKDIFSELPKYLKLTFELENVTLHHSAGTYKGYSKDYQINVTKEGIAIALDLNTRLCNHTYKRNSGNLGLSFLAMFGANQYGSYGSYPITKEQIEIMSKVIAVIYHTQEIDWDQIVDHNYFCKLDKYPSKYYKWDCISTSPNDSNITVYQDCMNKAKWYYKKYLGDQNV